MKLGFILSLLLSSVVLGCGSKFLEPDKGKNEFGKISEYDDKLKVETLAETPPPPAEAPKADAKVDGPTIKPTVKKEEVKKKSPPPPPLIVADKKKAVRQPDIEDAVGFEGRRPVVDPFRVGEKVKLAIRYLGIRGGDLTTEIKPFVNVNGRKAYHLTATLKTAPFFSSFYSVDDYGETFFDYEEMIPYNMSIKVKETGQLREVRQLFDWKTMKASFWEQKYTKKHGHQEKKHEWEILPYSQNVFSAVYYLRTFTFDVGKTLAFRVADENRNMVVKAHVVAKEKVTVDIGTFDAIKIRPEVGIDGIFQPIGDVFFWLTDDDRKFLIKIAAKIRIGTFELEATELVKE